MSEILTGNDNVKYCVLNKYPNNFKTQDDFTKWEQTFKTEGIVAFIYPEYVAVCYVIQDAVFSNS